MIVVPDAGPLIFLGGAGRLSLLHLMYTRVVVPRVVFDEVVTAGAGLSGSVEVGAAGWIEVVDVAPDPALRALLDAGEAAAIPLAARLGATLLCDDGDAREVARTLGLSVIGTLGVLVMAKRDGHLDLVAPIIEGMRNRGMYVSSSLLVEVLGAVGEHVEGRGE